MRTQSPLLGSLLAALLVCGAVDAMAQAKPGAGAPAAAAKQTDVSKFSEQQIKQVASAGTLMRLSQAYNKTEDLQRFTWTLERLVEVMPHSGPLKLQLAALYAQQDQKSKAYDLLVKMQTQGFGYDLSKDERYKKISDTKVWDYIVTNLQANAKPFGEGTLAFQTPAADLLLESIAWDPKRKQFLLGSVREGQVVLADAEGKLTDFITANDDNGMWSVYDLGVDAKNDLLYVASAGAPHFRRYKESDYGKAGLFKFQLSSGKFLGKYLPPDDGQSHILSSLVVGKDGQVFVADGVRNEIYKLEAAGLKLLIASPGLTSVRGMALSDDGKTLYFADYALGLLGVDLSKASGFAVGYDPAKLVLGGIDGLYYYDGTLTVIENGMVPPRVMRLKLTPDGHGIAGAMPLDVAQPAFTAPTFGVVVDSDLYFIANSQKGLYDKYGVLKDATKLAPTRIFKSNLRYEWDKAGVSSSMSAIPAAKPGG